MSIDLAYVRTHYSRLTDHALREALALGREAFRDPAVWEIIQTECRRRNLADPTDVPRAHAQHPRGPEGTYYDILGVNPTASSADIQRAWRIRAKETHPDTSTLPDAERRFKALNQAYHVLRTPELRDRYDQHLTERQRDAAGTARPSHPVYRLLEEISPWPSLRSLAGTGEMLLGHYHEVQLGPRFLTMSWLTFLYVPILPAGIYLVELAGHRSSYYFYGELSFANLRAAFGDEAQGALLRSALGQAARHLIGLALLVLAATLYRSCPAA